MPNLKEGHEVQSYHELTFFLLFICGREPKHATVDVCSQRTTCGTQLSPSAIEVPRIELRLSGLKACTFIHQVILPLTKGQHFKNNYNSSIKDDDSLF